MSRALKAVALTLALSACGDSCGCGKVVPEAKPSASAAPQSNAAQSNAAQPDVVQPGVAGAGSPSAAPSLPPELLAMRNQLVPNPDEEERAKLEAAAAKIDGVKDLGDPRPAARFESALPAQVGDYRADGPAVTGTSPAEAGTATVAARRYRDGESLMNVKITDTADAPSLRRELAQQLAMTGNAPTGGQRGRIAKGISGVLAYHEAARASRAVALVSGRFLVEVMVEQASDEEVAWSAVEALELKRLQR
jgi:hypothetical protein